MSLDFFPHYYFGLDERKCNVSTLGRRVDSSLSLLSLSTDVIFRKEENRKE